MKNTEASTPPIRSPKAQELYDKYGNEWIDIKQLSEIVRLSVKHLRKLTTAKFKAGAVPDDLVGLYGKKIGRKRFWHVGVVADWLYEKEAEMQRDINNNIPKGRGRPSKHKEELRKQAQVKRQGRPPKWMQELEQRA
ncbi:MAG: hypothetical protein G8D88_13960 [gamma proteobacterium symbiont of Ctena orbiculata]